MPEIRIDLELRLSIPDKELNVNSLVFVLKENMANIAFKILEALLHGIEERAISEMQRSWPGRYVRNGHERNWRQFRTSFGLFRYRFAQLYDRVEQKTVCPLKKACGIVAYQRILEESLEPAVGLAVHLSYRRSAKEIERIKGSSIGKSSLHRGLQEFSQLQCRWPNMKKVPYRFLMVDGTGVTIQDGMGHTVGKTQMRWALASRGERSPFEPVGLWVNTNWASIEQDLKARLDYGKLEVLFSDGGSGIQENLLEEGMVHQRCIWHGKRDFPYLLYADGLKKPQQQPFREKLDAIPAMRLDKAQLEELKPEDLPKVKELADITKQAFRELIRMLDPAQYPKARVYIENLSEHLCTFFDWWIEHKQWIPITTNAVETAFSQVKNRIKRIGRRWTEKGLINWLMVTMKKIFFHHTWENLWRQYLNLNLGLKLIQIKSTYQWV